MQPERARQPISLYDVVAERLRAYTPEGLERLRGRAEKPDPEDRFTALVFERLKPDDLVLDVGCGDGNWLRLVVAPRAARTVGIDYGIARLEHARDAQRRAPVGGLAYVWADARSLPFPDSTFSALIDRRGPLTASDHYLREGLRVLRPGGLVFEIGIGELNTSELHEVFGRGQMHGERERGPRLARLQELLQQHGATPLLAESHTTRMRYPGREGLVHFLETTPALPDFDRDRDAASVDQVVRDHSSDGDVILTMHRIIVIAQKD